MGTALAKLLAETGREVRIWVREPEIAEEIERNHTNGTFLDGFDLPRTLSATTSFDSALDGASVAISAVPSQFSRGVWERAARSLSDRTAVVSASKGVEKGSAKLVSEVLADVIPGDGDRRLAFVSGPSFAVEVASGSPTAVVAASRNQELVERVQRLLSTGSFRVYTTDDVVGVELGGALKNVIALAVGMAEGMGLGHNTRAALITRGLAEISRLAVACGASPLTLAGLAGVGDLVLTCTGHLSRNLQVGMRLGRGEKLEEILSAMKMVAEGVETSRSARELARRREVEMPIAEAVVAILDGRLAPADAVTGLMSRRLRAEREF